MTLPKEISRKARPARAGFIKFCPSPPKKHLVTRMAKTPPRIGAYSGMDGGMTRASRRPVTTAEQSVREFFLRVIMLNTNSVAIQEAMLHRMTNRV